jgi:diadenosine tetraphosphatase ApaH/serine/threonine PP2A family protein phosphatase
MIIALISDIHGNALALEACLAHARALGALKFVFLGDLVGYGAEPEHVVSTVRDHARAGAVVIKGNHDHAIAVPDPYMNATAREAIAWTRTHLSAEAKAFLADLPLTIEEDDRLYVHADASAPARWNYITGPDEARLSLSGTKAAITFCGHVHVPQLYCLSATGKLVGHVPVTNIGVPLSQQRQWLAVIGSAGQPRDRNPAAAFATYDTSTRTLTARRAPYNVEAAADKIHAAGLPASLAARLFVGR